MIVGNCLYFVFRPFGRWGFGLWKPDQMVDQEFSDAIIRGDKQLPMHDVVLRRLQSLLEWEFRLGPWALVRVPGKD